MKKNFISSFAKQENPEIIFFRIALAPADFFPGEGKIFHMQKPTICQKKCLKNTIIIQKVEKRPKGGGQVPLLPSPVDAYEAILIDNLPD